MTDGRYTLDDLRAAFQAGWKERNRNPGLKRVTRGTLKNVLGLHMPGHADVNWVADTKTYHNSIWLNSAFKKSISEALK